MSRTEKKRTGIKDIARLANVSIGTVDRVIHNRSGVSQATREKVLRIIREQRYEPNLLARSLASHRTYRFAVLIPSQSQGNSYWKDPLDGIELAENEILDYGIRLEKFFFDLYSPHTFSEISASVIRSRPDGILLAPIFTRETLSFIAQCDEAGIPYVFIDANIEGQRNLAYFGQDAYQSGYLAAKLLDYGLPGSAAILLVNLAGDVGNYNHLLQREKGFRAYFDDLGKINKKIYAIEIPGNLEFELSVVIRAELRKLPEIQGVFVTSNVQRVARIIDQIARNKPKLVGYDLTPENLNFLEKGVIDFLIGQKPKQQGYDAIYCLFDHVLRNKEVRKINYSSMDIITRENIQYYVERPS